MMKRIAAIILLAITLLLCGCSNHRVLRIRLSGDTLGETYSECIGESTTVRNMSDDSSDFYRLTQLPVYEIIPHCPTQEEFKEFAKAFGVSEEDGGELIDRKDMFNYRKYRDPSIKEEKKNNPGKRLDGISAVGMDKEPGYYSYEIGYSGPDQSTPYVPMSDAELEKAAWDVFNRIPFFKGLDYEYVGVVSEREVTNPDGTKYIECVRVNFRRLVDGIPVNGNDMCYIYFNGSGVCEIVINMFDYKKVGMMDVVPYKTALENVREPDAMVIPAEKNHMDGKADTMTVERTKLFYINQYTEFLADEGMILQPCYSLKGTLSNSTGSAEFNSLIIAIPNKYTYKEKLYTDDDCC